MMAILLIIVLLYIPYNKASVSVFHTITIIVYPVRRFAKIWIFLSPHSSIESSRYKMAASWIINCYGRSIIYLVWIRRSLPNFLSTYSMSLWIEYWTKDFKKDLGRIKQHKSVHTYFFFHLYLFSDGKSSNDFFLFSWSGKEFQTPTD